MADNRIIKNNLEELQKENSSLKNQLKLLKDKENSYQDSISRIKQMQSEYETSYAQSIDEYKKHEEEIKKKYLEFQNILEKQNEENEKRLTDKIELLKNELKEKDNIINELNEKINLLNEKITKEEMNYYFKEKEYEDIILSKERKLNELNEAIRQIVQETSEEIKRLSDQLEEFQKRAKLNNPLNLLIEKETIENKYNLNNLNKNAKNLQNNSTNNIVRHSQNNINNSVLLSDRFKNKLKEGDNNINSPQILNNSYVINRKINNNNNEKNDKKFFYTQNNFYNKNNNQDIMTQLYLLQNEKNLLTNELKQKEKEVNFWRNLRSKMRTNIRVSGNIKNSINMSNRKYLNDIKIRNMEKTLANYGNKINKIKRHYNASLKNHQREINRLRNEMEIGINIANNKINEGNFNSDSYEVVENDSNDQKKSFNEDLLLHSLKITIPSKEGIRNEYINSQVEKIKNSENNSINNE